MRAKSPKCWKQEKMIEGTLMTKVPENVFISCLKIDLSVYNRIVSFCSDFTKYFKSDQIWKRHRTSMNNVHLKKNRETSFEVDLHLASLYFVVQSNNELYNKQR